MKLTAFTKIIVTLAITAWVFILPLEAVATILVLQLALLLYIKHDRMTMAAIGGLAVFTGMMILLQLLFGSPLSVALFGGLRMLVMTMAFLCLLAATRIQDIAKALVDRFRMPCEYAFMLTTAQGGYLLPVVYAIATGLPVVAVAWILAYSVAGLTQAALENQWL